MSDPIVRVVLIIAIGMLGAYVLVHFVGLHVSPISAESTEIDRQYIQSREDLKRSNEEFDKALLELQRSIEDLKHSTELLNQTLDRLK